MKSTLLLSAILTLLAFPLMASEVDNFSSSGVILKDSKDSINQYSNNVFDEVLYTTNFLDTKCNEQSLYRNLRKEFHNHLAGRFAKYIINSKEIERITTTVKDSIYGDFTLEESPILALWVKYVAHKEFASVINVNGNYVGVDKFEHFAGTGYIYFMNHYIDKNSIESTLKIGTVGEEGLLGGYTTGVISYGDMAAEFNGMRFWNDILANNPDIIGQGHGPYVKCEKNHWVKVKEIDFSDYVDSTWDESLNCSKFRTDGMLSKVKKRLKKLEDNTGKSYSCPMNRELITNTASKYGPYGKEFINIEGHSAEKN